MKSGASATRWAWLAKTALVTGGTIVALGLGEALVRLSDGSKTWASYRTSMELLGPESITGEQIGYRRPPGLDRPWIRGSRLETNSAGFRDAEHGQVGGGVRLAYLGDSVTEGFGLPVGDRFSALVDSALRSRIPSASSWNLAVAGHATVDAYATLSRYGLPHDPNVVILQLGANDIGRNQALHDAFDSGDWDQPARFHPRRRPCGLLSSIATGPDGSGGSCSVKRWLQDHSALYLMIAEVRNTRTLRRGGTNSILDSVLRVSDSDWRATEAVLKKLANLCSAQDARLMVFYSPLDAEVQTSDAGVGHALERRLQASVQAINEGLEPTARVRFVPVVSPLRASQDQGLFLDDVHLSRAGHEVVAAALLSAISEEPPA